VREAVSFAQTTAARGRRKVVVVYPAERMNLVAANTLLKTLEEPPGDARFVLASARPAALPATVRSRCEALRLELPPQQDAVEWLAAQGVARPEVLLAACGGQPQRVLEALQQGIDAALWQRFPALVARSEAQPLLGWPLPWLIDALQKLSHDSLCVAVGASPRYFPPSALARGATVAALTQWAAELRALARQAEHPWNAGLAVESLVQQGRIALGAAASRRAARPAASLHSR
jgi:DNA polymerase-3 subunit delta'